MKEKFEGEAPKEDVENAIEPTVPVPEDFPKDRKVTRPPGLSIEEQRRKADVGQRMHRHGEGTLNRPITRHG